MMTKSDYSHHFSAKNIPFGIASSNRHANSQCVTRIENKVVFLQDLVDNGFLNEVDGLPRGIFSESTLNSFAALPKSVHCDVRQTLQKLYSSGARFPDGSTEDISEVTMHLPVMIGDFTDFSCSLSHVKNAGRIVVNDERPPPAFFNLPLCYAGRASSVVASGTPIQRAIGQFYDKSAPMTTEGVPPVICGPSRQMDYELEFAAIVGKPLGMNKGLNAADADEHIFGFVILNDWSARDIQGFEMRPLGPCNGKNLGTTISPWVVTMEALEPFRIRLPEREIPVVSYLQDPDESLYSIDMTVDIISGDQTTSVCKSNLSSLYWNIRQMAAHIVSAGSGLRTGDLLATGTVSGTEPGSYGCLLETTEGGKNPVKLRDGTERNFLNDGDIVRMVAVAGGDESGVGFGDCVGELLPARHF